MGRKQIALIKEKDGIRGLVPSKSFGINDKVYGAYLQKLDPRNNPDIQEALAGTGDIRFKEFLERIMSSRYRRVSLQTIAKACNIGLGDFNSWWQKESTQRAIAIAQTKSLEITADMAQDAMSIRAVCERCDGLTFIPAEAGLPEDTPGYRSIRGVDGTIIYLRACPVCVDGKVRKPGDPHARDRVLEMSGLIQRNKSAVTLVQNFGGASHSSAVSALDDAMPLDLPYTVEK